MRKRQKRRRDGHNGYYKGRCVHSRTGWAWHWVESKYGECTCEPCTPPKIMTPKSIEEMRVNAENTLGE